MSELSDVPVGRMFSKQRLRKRYNVLHEQKRVKIVILNTEPNGRKTNAVEFKISRSDALPNTRNIQRIEIIDLF